MSQPGETTIPHGPAAPPSPDVKTSGVEGRFRTVFALAAVALALINAAVAGSVLYQQRQMRDVAIGLYDHAFLANADMNDARVQFQRFADQRESVSGLDAVSKANRLLDPVIDALDAAADRADEPELRAERLAARLDAIGFEADFRDAGPAVWSRLKLTQAELDKISAHAVARGLVARDAVEQRSGSVTLLLSGFLVAGGALGLATLMILRRSVTASAMARLSRMANYDVVTGLPNRNLLMHHLAEQLEGVRRGDRRLAVMAIDLDRFKQVNDTLGHKFGDRLLMEAGERIKRVVRAEDTAARFGGDEFVLMLRDVHEPAEAAAIAGRLVAALSAPYEFDGQRVLSGASVGVAMAPTHGDASDDLLRHADLALYKAKEAGKGQFRFFEEGLNEAVQERRTMEIDLRETLEQDRIEVYFQPVVDVESGAIVACEALARWRRPGRGFVSPAEFIPLAEETGLIAALGESVLSKACYEAARWSAPIRVSVNLSARQFYGVDLVAQVDKILDETGLPPTRLELEITESILVGDKSGVLRILSALRERGVHIALDDFGTGYSSLSYLSSFPFDRIKVDRSFVTDVADRPDAAAIVRAVTNLAQTLGMSTTAEGVESRSDIDWLKAHGCDLAQGYLVSKPVPPEEFARFLASWSGESIRTVSAAA